MRTSQEQSQRLYYYLIGLALFYIIAAIDPIFNQKYLLPKAPKFYLTALVLPIFMYWLALTGLLKKTVNSIRKKSGELAVDKNKIQQLMKAMQEKQLYKDPDLSLPSLSQHLGLRTNELSRLINVGLNKTFTDFVNDFRLAEVKERLLKKEDEQFTLLGIALEAGFRSKTTFNRVFRERTGMAPKSYKKSAHLIERSDIIADRS